ncbi:MAG: cysteine desulfurase NifS [Deltaproteobacteria bacterium]|nr:cysteine desulfurase NifS [Deltaproteobacteria bacterium]
MKKIYLDNNATTAVHPEVFDAMLPYLKDEFGNPSSIHWAGRNPRKAIDEAREKAAKLLNCDVSEIIFTSCGSEGDNLAIKGIAESKRDKGNHIITTKVEHPAVLGACKYLAKTGFDVTFLDVDSQGMLDLEQLKRAITSKTILITIMFANNETGVIFPIDEIGKIAKEHNILFHTDAVQGVGKVPIDVKKLNVDLLTLSGHKIYAPKGVAAVYVKRGVRLVPLIHGGHQERNRRGGTENTAGIAALGKACEIALRDMAEETKHITALRDRLENGLREKIPYVRLNGHPTRRIPNTVNLSFEFVEGESLLLNLDMKGVAASSGSACTSGTLEPSHVLLAMGVPMESAHGSVRFSLGRGNSAEDIDYVIEALPAIVERMRSMSPLYSTAAKQAANITFSESGSCSH